MEVTLLKLQCWQGVELGAKRRSTSLQILWWLSLCFKPTPFILATDIFEHPCWHWAAHWQVKTAVVLALLAFIISQEVQRMKRKPVHEFGSMCMVLRRRQQGVVMENKVKVPCYT